MDERNETLTPEEAGYAPRPAWQVWAARFGLVIFIGIVIAQVVQIAGAGR